MSERIVVSPAAGVFTPAPQWEVGTSVDVGDVLGHIGEVEVRSLFAGSIGGFNALDGERVLQSQPIVWLRTA